MSARTKGLIARTRALTFALVLAPCSGLAAQQQPASRLQPPPAVDLADSFERVAQYNRHLAVANAARVSGPKHRTRAAVYGGSSLVLLGVTAMQYQEAMRQLEIGDGTGFDVPATISAVAFGGALWSGLRWLSERGDAQRDALIERNNVAAARALLPTVDPSRPPPR